MKIAAKIFVGLVAVEHILFMILEMFLWQHPNFGLKIFHMTPEVAATSAKLAFNQGLYNGFLAAGLIWSGFFIKEMEHQFKNTLFFLLCVIVAGIVGAFTAKLSILFTQGMPALIAFILVLAARKR